MTQASIRPKLFNSRVLTGYSLFYPVDGIISKGGVEDITIIGDRDVSGSTERVYRRLSVCPMAEISAASDSYGMLPLASMMSQMKYWATSG
ncbi:MAG: hypothetical protein LPD71_14870 [Shewanella sp.]|nr:hypothetical protein [Shewanella sp.]MCF1430940.1 hypothetical protein [Shewanella sp.]MCF1439969.1 hypothetical protein [Shewanella sp.]MCF1458140.1 hypothetical protein [Shewanella sp.]